MYMPKMLSTINNRLIVNFSNDLLYDLSQKSLQNENQIYYTYNDVCKY